MHLVPVDQLSVLAILELRLLLEDDLGANMFMVLRSWAPGGRFQHISVGIHPSDAQVAKWHGILLASAPCLNDLCPDPMGFNSILFEVKNALRLALQCGTTRLRYIMKELLQIGVPSLAHECATALPERFGLSTNPTNNREQQADTAAQTLRTNIIGWALVSPVPLLCLCPPWQLKYPRCAEGIMALATRKLLRSCMRPPLTDPPRHLSAELSAQGRWQMTTVDPTRGRMPS